MKHSSKENVNDKILDDILSKLPKANFCYADSYDCNKAIENLKKHPLQKHIVILFLIIFYLLAIISIISLAILDIKIPIIIIVLSIFLISLIATVFIIRKSILKYSNRCNAYFYDDFFIKKFNDKEKITKCEYSKISQVVENENYIRIHFKKDFINIAKKQIDNDFTNFLKKLQTNYKNNSSNDSNSNDSEKVWKSLLESIKNYKVSSLDDSSETNLTYYFNTKTIKKDLFLSYFFIDILRVMLLFIFFPTVKFFLFVPVIALILTIISMKNRLSQNARKNLEFRKAQDCKDTYYFYENFILITNNNEISKRNYEDIKYIFDNDEYIFIKLKSVSTIIMPIVVSKESFKNKEFLYDKIKKSAS